MVSRMGFWARKNLRLLTSGGSVNKEKPTSLHLNFATVKGKHRGIQEGSCSGAQTSSDPVLKRCREHSLDLILIVATSNCEPCITMEGFHLINTEALELFSTLFD